ncbi:hypothetical protein GOBAR_DD30600 [Gossypium barbadense]|nr:hypothetical protein GOBAR_DD30600 [Gossypium barbadense]
MEEIMHDHEEDGGMHRRHASPSVRDRNVKMPISSQSSASAHLPGYQTSAIVAMDRTSTLSSGTPLASGLNLSQSKYLGKGAGRTLESVLHASKQKVPMEVCSEVWTYPKNRGVDPPSSRDPPFPAVVPASNSLTSSLGLESTTSTVGKGSNRNGGLIMSDIISQILASKDSGKLSYRTSATTESLPAFISYSAKRASERQERGSLEEKIDIMEARRSVNPHVDRQYLDTPYRDVNSRNLQNNQVPNFQRPLLRKHIAGRMSAGRRKSFDDCQLSLGEMSSYVEVPASLNDALSEGLSLSSDWSARVAAFTYLRSLLLQGPKGCSDTGLSADQDRVAKSHAITSFNKHAMNSEGSSNIGILKLWLAKLTPLVHDKNTKLKDVAITCIISVYSNFDPTAVLNFILSLSVEKQNFLRRALKRYTPRIEVDLINYLQNKKERQRKSSYDPSDVVGTSSEEGYIGVSKKSLLLGRYSAGSTDGDGGRKWGSTQESTLITGNIGLATSDETQDNLFQNLETSSNTNVFPSKTKESSYMVNSICQTLGSQTGQIENLESSVNLEGLSTPHLEINGPSRFDTLETTEGATHNGTSSELDLNHLKPAAIKVRSMPDTGPSIPQILHVICNGNDESPTASKHNALQQLYEISVANDLSVWTKYANQILTAVLEVLDDSDSSIRELALSLIIEMLKNQKGVMGDSVEIVIEKLLHVMKDNVPKVSNEAEHCLNTVLSEYDPFRCLSVIVPLLVTEDEKTLVICINCLTKLVGRLSQEELTAQLPSFLPALFEAFGNQSADVRKTVVFCLVDIYIMLGKSFLPHLEGLNSTQLRLVTIYANRISQARTGTPIDAGHE